jgi:hypothetical protein
MSDVNRYEALMLEHLYGLLDADETRDLEAFLATPEGTALRTRAESWKNKIKSASRSTFPGLEFSPPADRKLTPAVRPPAATTVTMKAVWTRWAVAACLLLVFGGLGGPAAYQFIGWYAQSHETEQLRLAARDSKERVRKLEADEQAKRDSIRQEQERAVAAHQAAEKAYVDALTNARNAVAQKDFVVRLRGPDHIQPGAPNDWLIDTLTKQGTFGAPKKIEVAVKDQKDTDLLRETFAQPKGSTKLSLPVAFWDKVKPGTDLFLEVVAYTDDDRKSVLAERLPLARPVYVTHLVTDKPLYKPGEIVRFRSLTLDRATFLPPPNDLILEFRLKKPDGALVPLDKGNGRLVTDGLEPVIGPDGNPVRGIGAGEYTLPGDAPGGEYTLEVVEITRERGRDVRNVLDTRKFLVAKYVPDVFEKRLEFDGKSYGPGDRVQARIEVSRTAGGPMKNAKATVNARVDGRVIHSEKDTGFKIVTDPSTRQAKAVLNVRFQMPADIYTNRGNAKGPINALVDVTINDGSDTETIVRPIPLADKELKVEFFPEGGDLVEGVPCRVYFQVRTPAGKPADLKGIITDGKDTVAEVATLTDAEYPGVNRGQGVFMLTPQAGKKYFLKLRTPIDITEPTPQGFELPAAKADGIVLTALDSVTEKGGAIRVRVQSPKGPKTLHVGAYARGRLIAQQQLKVEDNTPVDLKLQGDESAGGVTRVTVFEETKPAGDRPAVLTPRAERLVYRKPGERLILAVNPDKNRYSPAAKVALEIAALNEKERPTPAILLVGVINQSVIAMADIKTDRLMPTHFLLAGDVRNPGDLEHADFLLTDNPKAGVALDLLLGTQGWRRFAEQNILPGNPAERREVERMLVAHGKATSAPVELYRLEEKRVAAEFQPKLEQSGLRLADADSRLHDYEAKEAPAFRNRLATEKSTAERKDMEYQTAAAELYNFETRAVKIRSWALPSFLLGLLVVICGGVAFAVSRPARQRRPYVATAGGSLVLAGLVIAAIVTTLGTEDAEIAFAKKEREERETYVKNRFGGGAAVQNALPPGKKDAPELDPPPQAVRGKEDFLPLPPPRVGPPKLGPKLPAFDPKMLKPDRGDGQAKRNFEQIQSDKEKLENVARVIPQVPQIPGGPVAVPPFVVREYAHQRDPSLPLLRADFTETVYWHPVLVLPDGGRTKIEFQLSDDIARYQILVAGHTTDGRIGAITKTIEARKSFTVDPKLPQEITNTDVVDVPVRVVNDSDDRRAVTFALTPSGLSIENGGVKTPDGVVKDTLDLGPNAKGRKLFRLKPTLQQGLAGLAVLGNSDPAAEPDAIGRVVTIVPEGFPVVGSFSDMLESRAAGTITLPKDLVKGTLKMRLEVYPTSMADLVKGLEGLIREPNGCFEQASTSNYPNSLILDYLNQTNQTNPQAVKDAKEKLDAGYARLTGYECLDTPQKSKQGFEWFGAPDRAHEALTAYGLLQFKDMARVYKVDPELIKRTQAFLMYRRDGMGGFKRNPTALDSFGGAPKHTTDAYIVWALVESDPDDSEKLDLKKEIEALKTEALKEDSRGGKDSYFVALTANVLLNRGDHETATKLLDRLKDKNFKAGTVTGAETSITHSGGRDLEIETTALAMLGWMRANDTKYAGTLKEATKWLSQQRGGYGGFGSTQSTIMALKALIVYAKQNAHPPEAGEIKFLVGGKPVGTRQFTENDVEVIALEVEKPEELFPGGAKTEVEIVTTARHPYPFALSYTGTTLTPVSAERCAVRVETKLGRDKANEGETVPLTVTLDNREKQGQGMAVAIVGLPAGMKVPTDMKQLIDLREQGTISFFEIRGRELVIYWRELAPDQKITLTVDLVCDVPGEYRGPASRGYLYYNADHKHWVEPLSIKIIPMAPKDEAVAQK